MVFDKNFATKRIGFIGAGKMAKAMIQGFLKSGVVANQIIASTRTVESKVRVEKEFGIAATTCNNEVASLSDVIFICVKPTNVQNACDDIVAGLTYQELQTKIVISAAAGVPRVLVSDWLQNLPTTFTMMPNLPVSVNEGAIALYGSKIKQHFLTEVTQLLSKLGKVYQVESEVELAYMVGIAGSAPAYYYAMVEAIEQAAKHYALTNVNVSEVVRQTTRGTLTLLAEQAFDASYLKDMVASSGGTTREALNVIEEQHIGDSLHDAMEAAVLKTMKQLSYHLSQSNKPKVATEPC
ncbi:pyrroline-5-carboxylate reductase family protein [Psychrosphaera algicola]|uniref:Pyrroline-5-carboxylate reductase n=1 Tax=Psychrosphaera algicola TaxID=3023714 RepID=A0ABT5FHF4_9GAMM|nr:pyrroline-5-carboxylate reductase [Psychrosphaera sp. G1-22]MDC2890636.1 pyrroline-5-carboxylate reductase [Psychrosphaera sp. G1-22]